MMSQPSMRAYCGLDCMVCGAFIATRDNNDTLRKKTAMAWSKLFSTSFLPSEINCMGCHSEKLQFGHCSTCTIRKCAREKELENCAVCNEYPCDRLKAFMETAPEAKEALEQLRSQTSQ